MLTKTPEQSSLQPFAVTPKLVELITFLSKLQSEGRATVFIELSGHICKVQVRIFSPVWMPNSTPVFSSLSKLDNYSISVLIENMKYELADLSIIK